MPTIDDLTLALAATTFDIDTAKTEFNLARSHFEKMDCWVLCFQAVSSLESFTRRLVCVYDLHEHTLVSSCRSLHTAICDWLRLNRPTVADTIEVFYGPDGPADRRFPRSRAVGSAGSTASVATQTELLGREDGRAPAPAGGSGAARGRGRTRGFRGRHGRSFAPGVRYITRRPASDPDNLEDTIGQLSL